MPTISFGAIRWAWRYAYNPAISLDLQPTCERVQTERALWPAAWQHRAPLGSTVRNSEVLSITADQAAMEAEIAQAAAGNLSYWAYLRYAPIGTATMERALTLHKTASNRALMKWCSYESENTLGAPGAHAAPVARLVAEMLLPEYFKVLTNRPLVYVYGTSGTITAQWGTLAAFKVALDALRTAAQAAGLGNPYIVTSTANDAATATALGADATGNYISSVPLTLSPAFAALRTSSEGDWPTWGASYGKLVPTTMAGWHRGPRMDRPEWWAGPRTSGGARRTYGWLPFATQQTNVTEPTSAEMIAHVSAAFAYVNANPTICDAKTVLCYAWDENSEGGYLCPTLGNTGGKIVWIASTLASA